MAIQFYDKDGNVLQDLFVGIAKRQVEEFKQEDIDIRDRKKNLKTTKHQVRKFYNEVLIFAEKIENSEDVNLVFRQQLPYLRMLSAKASYAMDREHVTPKFQRFISECVNLVEKPKDLSVFKTFFEAVVAYSEKLK